MASTPTTSTPRPASGDNVSEIFCTWEKFGRDASAALLLFVGCLASQQHASVSQGQVCSDICTCCHTEIENADHAFYLI